MSEDNRDYTASNEMLIRREERKHEQLKAKAEAAKANMEESIAAALKQLAVKKALIPDVVEAYEDEHGERLAKIKKIAGSGEIWGGEVDDHNI